MLIGEIGLLLLVLEVEPAQKLTNLYQKPSVSTLEKSVNMTGPELASAVERKWRTQDSQGQILAPPEQPTMLKLTCGVCGTNLSTLGETCMRV